MAGDVLKPLVNEVLGWELSLDKEALMVNPNSRWGKSDQEESGEVTQSTSNKR